MAIISPSETEDKSVLNVTPGFLTQIGLLIILKDIIIVPERYKIHHWITWLLEAILCEAATKFVLHVIWYRIEEMVEIFVKRLLLENDSTWYFDAEGDSLVNFMLMVFSGGFLVFAVFITNTHLKVMNFVEKTTIWIHSKFNSLYKKFTTVQLENIHEPQPEERVAANEEPNEEEFSSPPQPMQCVTICAPGLRERCGDGPSKNSVERETTSTNIDVRTRIPRRI